MKRKPHGHYEPTDHPGIEQLTNPQLVNLRDDINQELNAVGTRSRYLNRKRDHISAILRSRADPPIKISDHAVIRYLEKVKGHDLDAMRAEISALALEAKDGLGIICRGKGDAVKLDHKGLSFIITHDYVVATLYLQDSVELGLNLSDETLTPEQPLSK